MCTFKNKVEKSSSQSDNLFTFQKCESDLMKCFVYISKVWWNVLFTFQKYDEILCLHFKSMMKYFVYISKVWWNALFTLHSYDETLCLQLITFS